MPRLSSTLASMVAAAAVLLLLTTGVRVIAAKTHKVGGPDAWGVPPSTKPDVYLRWAESASARVTLGDALMFLYPPVRGDAVVQVTAKAAAACNVSAPLLRLADGNSVFNLTAPGRAYFTSARPGRCRRGQRVTVDVPTANGTRLPPTADDLAALAAIKKLPPPAAPTQSLPALDDVDSSAAAPRAAAASVVLVTAAVLSVVVLV